MRTHNTGFMRSNPANITIKIQLARKTSEITSCSYVLQKKHIIAQRVMRAVPNVCTKEAPTDSSIFCTLIDATIGAQHGAASVVYMN